MESPSSVETKIPETEGNKCEECNLKAKDIHSWFETQNK